jgi:hypothetical protein
MLPRGQIGLAVIEVPANATVLTYPATSGDAYVNDKRVVLFGPNTGVSAAMDNYNNLGGWSWDPVLNSTNTAKPNSTGLYACRVAITKSYTIANIVLHISTAGATLTTNECFAGVYSDGQGTQNLLGLTSDQSSNWLSAAYVKMPVTVQGSQSLAAAAGRYVWVVVVAVGTTTPRFWGVLPNGTFQGQQTFQQWRWGYTGSTGTSLPPTLSFASMITDSNASFWAAVA